jgi:hypothetical protein
MKQKKKRKKKNKKKKKKERKKGTKHNTFRCQESLQHWIFPVPLYMNAAILSMIIMVQ